MTDSLFLPPSLPKAIDDAATGMIGNNHYASTDIDHHRKLVH